MSAAANLKMPTNQQQGALSRCVLFLIFFLCIACTNEVPKTAKFKTVYLHPQAGSIEVIQNDLNVSADAAYRRIRGDVALTIYETKILSEKYNISSKNKDVIDKIRSIVLIHNSNMVKGKNQLINRKLIN